MIRLMILPAALACLLGTQAAAQTMGYYVATPAVLPTTKARLVTSGTPWFVRDGQLLAPRGSDQPARVCRMVAARAGSLTGFSAAGRAFDAAELATCNAAAATPSVAGG